MNARNDLDVALHDLFLPIEVSILDRDRCAAFIERSGWEEIVALRDANNIRKLLNTSRAPAIKFAAVLHLLEAHAMPSVSNMHSIDEVVDDLRTRTVEELRGLYWNDKGNLLRVETLAVGNADSVELNPYAALRPAFMVGSRAMSLIHNHPSSQAEFSAADLAAFIRFGRIAKEVGIALRSLYVVTATSMLEHRF